jgi:hypothetical protein
MILSAYGGSTDFARLMKKSAFVVFCIEWGLVIEAKVFIQVSFQEFECTLRWVLTIVMDSKKRISEVGIFRCIRFIIIEMYCMVCVQFFASGSEKKCGLSFCCCETMLPFCPIPT